MHRSVRPSIRSSVAGACLLAVASCGSSSPTATTAAPTAASVTVATTSAATASAGTTTGSAVATTAKASAGAAGSGCADAGTAARKVIGDSAVVTDVKVLGGCMVSISTNLSPGAAGAATARDLCDKVADAAYAAGAKSLSIDSAVKHELAAGIKGAACIGEP